MYLKNDLYSTRYESHTRSLLTHSLTHSLTHLLTHLLTYSLTHLLTHSLTHSCFSYYNNLASTKLDSYTLSIFPGDCLFALRKLVCSRFHLKCYDQIQGSIHHLTLLACLLNSLSATGTVPTPYNNQYIYSDIPANFKMPMKRPCLSGSTK